MGRNVSTKGRRAAAAALATLLTVGGGLLATGAGRAADALPTSTTGLRLDGGGKVVGGVAALNRLGARLDVVAGAHGMSGAQLRKLLLTDRTLRLDPSDRLTYAEPTDNQLTTSFGVVAATGPDVGNGLLYPESQTFALHSQTGASRVIYLDFDGATTSNKQWNTVYNGGASIVSAPFSTDADLTTFSSADKAAIQNIWQRVAEDYAPWGVDVTTQDPGAAALDRPTTKDNSFGVTVVISNSSFLAAGGVSYVGIFNMAGGDVYKPAFVFANNLSYSAKNVAEAASHEVGHTLGLNHDGQVTANGTVEYYAGQGDWAPIMGVGYYDTVTQWSKGEYAGANNTQDDLAVIATYGLTVKTDDFGNTASAAATASGTTFSSSGILSSRTDVDAVKFTAAAGTLTLSARPGQPEGDLDLKLTLVNASTGAVIAATDDALSTSATITATIAAGTYAVLIDGVGSADPLTTGYSDYASIGRWFLDATLPGATTTTTAGTTTSTSTSSTTSTSTTSSTTTTVATGGSTTTVDPTATTTTVDPTTTTSTTTTTLAVCCTTIPTTTTSTTTSTTTTTRATTTTTRATTTTTRATTTTKATKAVKVSSVVLTSVKGTSSWTVTAKVTVVDATTGAAIPSATVSGNWSGLVTGSASATTNTSGVATLTKSVSKTGTMTFTVSNITGTGLSYTAPSPAPSGTVTVV